MRSQLFKPSPCEMPNTAANYEPVYLLRDAYQWQLHNSSFSYPSLPRMELLSSLDPCTSIEVGAWILAQNAKQLGYNWNMVGAYNARSPDKRLVYARKVYKSLTGLTAGESAPPPRVDTSNTAPILAKVASNEER